MASVHSLTEDSRSVLLVCVKYGADKETERYLKSIQTLETQDCLQILVVDNMEEGNWASGLPESNYRALQAPENLGYFGGARYGLSRYLQENPMPDWVIISNVDLYIEDPCFLELLLQLGSIPNIGAIAPSIRSALTGVDQNPYLRVRPSSLRMHLYKWLYRSWLAFNTYEGLAALYQKARGSLGKLRRTTAKPPSRETIYAPHGSFLILSRNYFDLGGDLQFPGFLFGEEIYLAETLRELGLNVVYEPSLRVVHDEHRSTKLFKPRKIVAHAAASAAYCANVFFPRVQRNRS